MKQVEVARGREEGVSQFMWAEKALLPRALSRGLRRGRERYQQECSRNRNSTCKGPKWKHMGLMCWETSGQISVCAVVVSRSERVEGQAGRSLGAMAATWALIMESEAGSLAEQETQVYLSF